MNLQKTKDEEAKENQNPGGGTAEERNTRYVGNLTWPQYFLIHFKWALARK